MILLALAVCFAFSKERYEYDPVIDVEYHSTEKRVYNTYDMDAVTFKDGFASYEDENYEAVQGIDVSEHNGSVNWKNVKSAGISFAMIRIGYRGYGSGEIAEDKYFARNIREADRYGLKIGVYFFSQAVTEEEAAMEAKWVIEKIHAYNIEMPVVYDYEFYPEDLNARGNAVTVSQRTKCAVVFLENIKNAGYVPMIYASTNTYSELYDPNYLTSYSQWIAEYGSACHYPYAYQIWQYTNEGGTKKLKNFDLDIWFKPKGE